MNIKNLTGDNIGESLHMALRKCMDSPISSIAWNAFHVIDETTTRFFYYGVYNAIIGAEGCTKKVLETVVSNWCLEVMTHKGLPGRSVHLLHSIFKMFSKEDWKGYVFFLSDNIVS